jgi:DNA-binding LytR/AlgR family response regulator
MYPITTILVGGRQNANPQEIILLQADINYTQVHLADGGKMTVATPLKILEKRFAACPAFFRTHKSFLINLNYIENYDATNAEVFVLMKNGFRIEVSRRKKVAFKKRVDSLTH